MLKATALSLFIGTDDPIPYHVVSATDESVALDVSAWTLSWMLKAQKTDVDASATLTKTTAGGSIVVSGTFNPIAAQNLQRATVAIEDTDTDALPAGTYYHELKRTDPGLERVLAYGLMTLRRSVHHA